MTKGIDVSVFQGSIDWKKVKKSGVQFAVIRGGYGRYETDERFEENYKNATEQNIPVGVYHYSYADTVEKAKQEAKFCLSYLKGKKFSYPVCFDIEDKTQQKLSKKLLTDITAEFCKTVEKAGYYVCIYSSKSFLTSKLDMKKLSAYDVWVAQWSDKCTYNGAYGMWQYSDSGKVKGINGRVDLDCAYRDYPSIIKNAGLNGFSKKDEKPVTKDYSAGQSVKLNKTPVYASATALSHASTLSGTYYIYDGIKLNNRYRITNSKRNVERLPISNYVTGWIDAK